MNTIRKIKNNILDTPEAAAEIPVNPKKAAISAIIKNIKAHFNKPILLSFDLDFMSNGSSN